MRDQLLQRLNELTAEFAKGEKAIARIEEEWKNTRDSLLRISGAIQVLKEELVKEKTLGISKEKQDNCLETNMEEYQLTGSPPRSGVTSG
jgi:uncharacterized Fe-S cluster-containing radical SAM superfamily protein